MVHRAALQTHGTGLFLSSQLKHAWEDDFVLLVSLHQSVHLDTEACWRTPSQLCSTNKTPECDKRLYM